MKKLIIITGDLAAGKSTLAASLGAELKIPFLTKDSLKEIACDAIGFTNREENRRLSVSATESMIYMFNQMAIVDQDIILEANFRNNEIRRIKAIADEYTYTVVLLSLTGEIHLLYQRFLDRLTTRHVAHTSLNLDMSLDRFAEYIESIRNEDMLYPVHKIDMTYLDEDEVVEEALNIIHSELGI